MTAAARVRTLAPYVPGEQPKDRPYIKLNANENPYPPSPRVMVAITALLEKTGGVVMARYPDPDSSLLRASLARMLTTTGGVLANSAPLPFTLTPDMVFCGNGSDEALSFVFYAFFDGDRPLVLPAHTYSFYPVYAQYYGIPLLPIALNADFSLDTSALVAAAIKTDSSVIIANPNAPTGIALSNRALRAFLEQLPRERAVIVDEAYADFAEESALSLLPDFPNLVIVRTFSKSLSFAGMRIGYCVASPLLINTITTVKNSFNHFPVDALAQCAAVAACEDFSWYSANARKIIAERESFSAFLRESGWTVLTSSANFIFACKPGTSGAELYRRIKEQGILVRHFASSGIEDFIRITIGTPEEMAKLRDSVVL